MNVKKAIKWASIAVGAMLVLLVAAVTLAMLLGVSINLDYIRDEVGAAATKALGREVAIKGSVSLLVSFQPSLEIEGVRVGNPREWEQGDFLRAKLVRGEIDIIPLLRKKIRIGEVRADTVQLSLETTSDGKKNWDFDITPSPKSAPDKETDGSSPLSVEFVELRELAFYNLAVIYRDGGLNRTYQFKLDALDGSATAGEPILISVWGSLQKSPFHFRLQGGSFEDFMHPEKPWKVLLSGKIGQSPLQGAGSLHLHHGKPEASLDIETESVSLGGLLSEFGIADSMEVDVERFGINVNLRGRNLKEMLERSDFSTSLENGRWFWPDPKNKVNMEFAITQGVIRSTGGKPVALNIDGRIKAKPFQVSLTGDRLVKLALAEKPWHMQLSAKFANAALRGSAVLVRRATVSEVTCDLVTEKIDIGEMLKQLNISAKVNASVDAIRLRMAARGSDPRELLEKSDVTIDLENGKYEWPAPDRTESFEILLRKAGIQTLAGKPLKMSLGGKIEDKTFSLRLAGDSLASLILEEKPWNMEMSGKFDQALTKAKVALVRSAEPPEMKLELATGKIDIGEVLHWLHIAKDIKAGVAGMQTSITARGGSLQAIMAESDFRYTFNDGYWTLKNPNMRSPVKVVISDFVLARAAKQPIKLNTRGLIEKTPTPGNEIPVHFAFNASARAERPDASNAAKAQGTGQRIYTVNVNGKIGESPLKIAGSLDRSRKIPMANLDLTSEQVNIGAILDWLEIAEGLDADVEFFNMNITARGKDVDEILAKSDFRSTLKNGKWKLRDPNTQAKVDIQIVEGDLHATAGKPITLAIDGQLRNKPVHMKMHTASLATFGGEIAHLPLRFEAHAAETHLKLVSDIQLPISAKTLNFELSFAGEKLNSLDELLEVSFPPLGPYSLHGRFAMNPKGYRISDFSLRVGKSDLTGEASLDTTAAKPRLNIDLRTKTLQINDFDFGEWSAVEKKEIKAEPGKEEVKKDAGDLEETREKIKTLLSPEVMQALNARLAVTVDKVLSGKDSLGSGSAIVLLENGRFSVNPLKLAIPGGALKMSFAYEPTAEAIFGEARANIDKFDYGILARRVKADANMKGKISLAVDVKSRAKDLRRIMHNSNGYIDFGIWPEDLEAGIFDLWAVNLFTAVVQAVDKEETSKINCVIGQYSLEDGRLREDNMVIDTTRIRVRGEAKADFKKEDVYLYLKSRGKRPEFFSLATPIEVKGKFSDFQFGVAPAGLIGTTIRFGTSPVHVPLRRTFTKDLPPDGQDVCSAPIEPRN